MIRSSVTVIGPPCSICFLNNGITEPEEPNTLPKRTIENNVLCVMPCSCANACKQSSEIRLVEPIILVGLTALSVEIKTNDLTLALMAALAVLYVPKILFWIPSIILYSTIGTCL